MKVVFSVLSVILFMSPLGSCDIPNELVRTSSITSSRDLQRPSCTHISWPICKDCNTVMNCMLDPAPEVACRTLNPYTPFCHNGACVAEIPVLCQAPFLCSSAGYFPDSQNCSRYHLCAEIGATGSSYAMHECPAGFVYNPTTTMCMLSRDCNPIGCTIGTDGIVLHPADHRYYAYCQDGEPTMFRCEQYFVFKPYDGWNGNCVFQCPREGRIGDPYEEAGYYDCYLKGTSYLYRKWWCTSGFVFDQSTEQCKRK